ncbi:hypothetical protein M9H77_33222 [Catharanthus roseus]|uniref:Uncharacterized protein n=1 Tax=Catharanthus roseus TaxID=4058 RepID=A0ACB9ZJY1_CATRO|nr:hypothetical protein M9H77_33222 [Catharanthus roseus]
MRIRKHAKISPLIYEASSLEEKGILIQTPHVINCQLNQSPWDVMIFPPPPFSSSSEEPEEVILPPQPPLPNLYQFDEEDDTYMADLTLPDSIAVDHNAPKKFELGDNKSLDKNNNGGNGNELVEQKKVGQCRKKGKEGNNFCQKNPQSSPVVVVKKSVSRRPVRPNKKQAVLSSSSSSHNNNNNPYEYYYYSGFGPRWGKKRGSVTAVISDSDHSAAAANKKTNVALLKGNGNGNGFIL